MPLFFVSYRPFSYRTFKNDNPTMHAQKTIAYQAAFFALLGLVFSFWSVQGNDVNLCYTAGCSLYHDVRIAGLSLWGIATGVFLCFFLFALFSPLTLGFLASGLAVFADTLLLLLMALTAPCLNCLGVALIFALTYHAFRRIRQKTKELPPTRSLLLGLWLFFFCINIGNVVRLHVGPWPLLGEEEATIQLYFSPSCPHCRDVIAFYGGSLNVAFYPVSDKESDIYRVSAMQKALQDNVTIEEALKSSQDATPWTFLANFYPDNLLLRFRLLTNKAHVFIAGSHGIPFLEYRGVPALVERELKKRRQLFEEENTEKEQPQTSSEHTVTGNEKEGGEEKEGLRNDKEKNDSLDFLESGGSQCTEKKPCP
ncbi:MAG: hypothetical protein J5803_02710 [Desulfovibrio sp.]|nr:hypothetical protein [Desulfovibrio sp.]